MSRTRFAALCALLLSLGAPVAATAKPTITMSGSTSIYPLASALAHGYVSAYKNAASFKILQGGSDVGINDVAHGRVSVGNASRDPEGGDPKGLVFNKIARDGVCLITNASNPVANLSQEQVQDIFAGRTRDWNDVPGAKVDGPIKLVSRTASSGTADAFKNIFMGPDLNVSGSAATKKSNGLVQQSVRSSKTSIGYVSFDFTSGVHPTAYKGVPCTLRNAKSGQYPGVRNFWMVTRGAATGAVAKFLKWVRTSGAAKTIVGSHWVPLH